MKLFVARELLDGTPRKAMTPARRKAVYAAYDGRCAGCDDVLAGPYQIDHIIPLALGGADEFHNLAALCVSCHRGKTASDLRRIAKAKRQAALLGERAPAKRPILSRGTFQIQGWRREWTAWEDRVLREEAHLGVGHLKRRLRRSASSIESHASQEGLSLGFLNPKRRPALDQGAFLERVEFEPFGGCWLWSGSLNGNGYGHVRHGGRVLLAHRLAWTIWRGAIPDGLFLCHKCDIRCCVNPDHLFLGTHAENMQDMWSKGRHGANRGEASHHAKLTEAQVGEIRSALAAGVPQREIAKDHGVTQSSISNIARGSTWKLIEEREPSKRPIQNRKTNWPKGREIPSRPFQRRPQHG